MGNVPVLLSSSPWMRRIGSLILSAFMKGDIFIYVSGACQMVRSSAWQNQWHKKLSIKSAAHTKTA
eukprot:scaffold675885_cov60-Prasinocladus_malaysianus.AAC.1